MPAFVDRRSKAPASACNFHCFHWSHGKTCRFRVTVSLVQTTPSLLLRPSKKSLNVLHCKQISSRSSPLHSPQTPFFSHLHSLTRHYCTNHSTASAMPIILPELPVPISDFVEYVDHQLHSRAGVEQAVEPFKAYENKLREIYAQQPDHPAASANHLVSIFESPPCTTRARDLSKESADEKDSYLLSLPDDLRRQHGSPATVQSLKDFRTNFTIFSESSLTELKWDNVVVAGSAVNTSLLPLKPPYSESKVSRPLAVYWSDFWLTILSERFEIITMTNSPRPLTLTCFFMASTKKKQSRKSDRSKEVFVTASLQKQPRSGPKMPSLLSRSILFAMSR